MAGWNPWHGCKKISAGCQNCYVYRMDKQFDKDSTVVGKNKDFDLPVRKGRNKEYKLKNDEIVYTCLSSDFFLEEADEWRKEAWEMIKEREDLVFFIITKRIDRFNINLPDDWNDGYNNVIICCTTENQDRADYRLPIFLGLPIKHKKIICEPLLEKINLSNYLSNQIEEVIVGGESGEEARKCDYDWVIDIRNQCEENGIHFTFKQTGANFIKDGKKYRIKRQDQHNQAIKANINL